jgi:hypothetical protein
MHDPPLMLAVQPEKVSEVMFPPAGLPSLVTLPVAEDTVQGLRDEA